MTQARPVSLPSAHEATRFAAVVTALHLVVGGVATPTHEMWRDELHCWLVALGSSTPWQVVRERAYDGQPPLWYELLWVLTRFTWHPELMRVVHLAIASTAVFLFARFAPFSRAPRVLFAFGYFVAYEYCALSRCYGLALVLALLVCLAHPRRYLRPWRSGLLLAALALTTTVATLVATAYAAACALDWLFPRARRDRDLDPDRNQDRDLDPDLRPPLARVAVVVGLAAAGIVAAALCAWPPPDSTVVHIGKAPEMPWEFATTRVVAAFVAVPWPYFFFWNSNALLGLVTSSAARFAIAVAIFGWAVFVLSRDRFATTLFALATALLVGLFAEVYSGSVRHHGFIFVAFLMAAWIASATPGPARPREARRRLLPATLVAVLSCHVPGAALAMAYDARYVFSSGKRAADELRSRGLQDALIVAELDFPATAVLGQLGPRSFAYSPRNGRRFSFVKWTADREADPTDAETLAFARRLGRERGEDPVLLMNRPLLPELVDGDVVVRLAEKYDSMIEEENFYVYRVRR